MAELAEGICPDCMQKSKTISGNMFYPDFRRVTHEFSEQILHAIRSTRANSWWQGYRLVARQNENVVSAWSKALRMPTDRFVLVTKVLKQEISSLIFASTSQSVHSQFMLPHRRHPALLVDLACQPWRRIPFKSWGTKTCSR